MMGFWSFCFRALVFALLWWILTQGAINSWLVGVPVVVLAVLASKQLLPVVSWSLSGIVRFIPFFLWRSLYGGVDVARRALHPKLPISPGLFDYRWRLPPGLPRVFMANTVSLLPGTLSAELGEEYLHVHVLDRSGDFIPELSIVEEHVARLFGLHLIDAESEE
jgi:multicomponent Na+:H+ antiporter subunit E